MGKTIIVTGGAGFIGSNFIFHMLDKHPEDRIVCLDKLTYAGNLSTLKGVMDKPNFRFVKMDICDRAGVFQLFEEELCYNSSAFTGPVDKIRKREEVRIFGNDGNGQQGCDCAQG